jgi:gluconokinase
MIVVVMGVSGVGKTTVGKGLAEALGARFLEGDQFHPKANIEKMSHGEPLTDADRKPWLERLAVELDASRVGGKSVVLACSALRRSYRDILRAGHDDVDFVFLDAEQAVIQKRLDARKGHFMPPSLLDSQFAALERPGPDERTVRAEATQPPDGIVASVLHQLRQRGGLSRNDC